MDYRNHRLSVNTETEDSLDNTNESEKNDDIEEQKTLKKNPK